MRERADEARLRRFMQALGAAAPRNGDCYLTGGATAVLLGWRATTVAVDLLLEPDQDEVLRAIPALKNELSPGGGRRRLPASRRRFPAARAALAPDLNWSCNTRTCPGV